MQNYLCWILLKLMWDFSNTYGTVLCRNTNLHHWSCWPCFGLPQCKSWPQTIGCFSWKSQSALPKLDTYQAHFQAFSWTVTLLLSTGFLWVKFPPKLIQPDHFSDWLSIKCYMFLHIYAGHLVSNKDWKEVPKPFHALHLSSSIDWASWLQFKRSFHKCWSS